MPLMKKLLISGSDLVRHRSGLDLLQSVHQLGGTDSGIHGSGSVVFVDLVLFSTIFL